MQLKKWLSQKTLFIKAAALTRSLEKPSVIPTQAKKLVTEGFDHQSLSLLHRTSLTKDDSRWREAVQGAQFPLEVCCSPPSPFAVRRLLHCCSRVLFIIFQTGSSRSHSITKDFVDNKMRVFLNRPKGWGCYRIKYAYQYF